MLIKPEYYQQLSRSRFLFPILSGISLFLMITSLVPFEVVLIPAVSAAPKRWRAIDAGGAWALAFVFYHLR